MSERVAQATQQTDGRTFTTRGVRALCGCGVETHAPVSRYIMFQTKLEPQHIQQRI